MQDVTALLKVLAIQKEWWCHFILGSPTFLPFGYRQGVRVCVIHEEHVDGFIVR